jgi:hypothetical protein
MIEAEYQSVEFATKKTMACKNPSFFLSFDEGSVLARCSLQSLQAGEVCKV